MNLGAGTKQEAIAELIEVLVRANAVKSKESALMAVTQRERLRATGLGHGVALPHGTDNYSDRVSAALGISRRGVDFGAEDGQPTHVIFMLLGHANRPQSNLHALDQAARLLHTPGIVEVALNAGSPAEMLGFVRAGTWGEY